MFDETDETLVDLIRVKNTSISGRDTANQYLQNFDHFNSYGIYMEKISCSLFEPVSSFFFYLNELNEMLSKTKHSRETFCSMKF